MKKEKRKGTQTLCSYVVSNCLSKIQSMSDPTSEKNESKDIENILYIKLRLIFSSQEIAELQGQISLAEIETEKRIEEQKKAEKSVEEADKKVLEWEQKLREAEQEQLRTKLANQEWKRKKIDFLRYIIEWGRASIRCGYTIDELQLEDMFEGDELFEIRRQIEENESNSFDDEESIE